MMRGLEPQLHDPHPREISWDCTLCDEAKSSTAGYTTPTPPEITLGVWGEDIGTPTPPEITLGVWGEDIGTALTRLVAPPL